MASAPTILWHSQTVGCMQAIGAKTPAFTALLSFIMLNSRETGRTYAALGPVVVGIVIATAAEPSLDSTGFLASATATAARALKSVLQVCLCLYSTTTSGTLPCHVVFMYDPLLSVSNSSVSSQSQAAHMHSTKTLQNDVCRAFY